MSAKRHFAGILQFLIDWRNQPGANEIWLRTEHLDSRVEHVDGGWQVQLPDCCVVCGDPAAGNSRRIKIDVVDYSLPTAVLGLGLIVGFSVGFFFVSILLVLVIVGGAAVIALRLPRPTVVQLDYGMCAAHTDRDDLPAARLHSQTLIVEVGAQSVRRMFATRGSQGAPGTVVVPTKGYSAVPPIMLAKPERTVPESIPLYEEPSSDETEEVDGGSSGNGNTADRDSPPEPADDALPSLSDSDDKPGDIYPLAPPS